MSDSAELKYEYKLEKFEGPLDLLLFLIRKNEVNIYDIPIAEITEQFLSYLDYAKTIDLDNLTEFYITAATLLYIKSRMLLPVEVDMDDEEEDPRQELVEKLIDYQKYKKLTDLIVDLREENEWFLERKKNQIMLPFENDENVWEQVEVWDLLQCFSQIMKSIGRERILDMYEEVSVNEKVTLINEILDGKDEFYFTELLKNVRSALEIICSFFAILECIKVKRIVVMQNRFFGEIKICANKGNHEGQNDA